MPRFIIFTFILVFITALSPDSQGANKKLPLSKTFIGQKTFQRIAAKAVQENWHQLPMSQRMVHIAKELESTPYQSYTLEIDNTIESPSVNFKGLDCWTFFETCLGFSRMLNTPKKVYTPNDLLKQIEHTRYRGGHCHGNYLDRLHYLADWFADNRKRKTIKDITRNFPTQRMHNKCQEMTILWKHYRYLKHNPKLRQGMARHEARITKMPVYMVPKNKVASIEKHLQSGDIIGIATKHDGSFCSHVGIIIKDKNGRAHFMHASTTYHKVVIDQTISQYLQQFNKHAGILIARPQ